MLTWEVVLDVEIALNNRPLCYLGDNIQLPALTPNSLLFLRQNQLPEPYYLGEVDLCRLAKYLQKCKQTFICGLGRPRPGVLARIKGASCGCRCSRAVSHSRYKR